MEIFLLFIFYALLVYVGFTLIVIVPLWKIFGKTGMNPTMSLIALVPIVGGLICMVLLAFAQWPAVDPD